MVSSIRHRQSLRKAYGLAAATRRPGPAPGQGFPGWHRQAESSELGDGGFPVRWTIAKAYRP